MASIFRRALRNESKSPSTIISLLNKSQPPIYTVASPLPLDHLSDSRPVQFPIFPRRKTEYSNPTSSSLFYPTFSFGLFLNPISSTGLISSVDEDAVTGDSQTIWADSVKKKRKRKMNKHKLKKLRKRLRRRT